MATGLLGIAELPRSDIEQLLTRAKDFQPQGEGGYPRLTSCRGKMVVNLFFEASTRTRSSFEIAARHLGAETLSITGDGTHEHPTQALLDARTILDNKSTLEGLRVAIIGDIAHSRVARSDIFLLAKFGVDIVLCGPPSLVPRELEQIAPGVRLEYDIRKAIRGADVIMMLRVQLERIHEPTMPASEYFQFYGLRLEHLELAKPDAIVMHPGPINRGRELSSEVADSQRSMILNQVGNGIAVRMAVLERVLLQ